MASARRVKAKKKGKTKVARNLSPFDKYHYYQISVQSPEVDAEFIRDTYRSIRKKDPRVLREDFCGTFALCCAWAQLAPSHQAIGVDLDLEPINYGRAQEAKLLTPEQRERVDIRQGNVLSPLPKADVSCGLNFSYFIFKEREVLKQYFANVYNGLNEQGVAFFDCFGGSKCCEANEEETQDDEEGYSYFWDQDSYDPVTNYAQFYIHFKRKQEKKRERVFSYDWRMWSIPELRDILQEVGFKDVAVYWEGNDKDGDGNGIFVPVTVGEECEAWVAYLVASK